MGASREVVITGLGVVTPIGIGCDPFWASLLNGRSGVRPIAAYDPRPMPVTIGAELRDFDPKQHVKPRKALKVMCREIQTAFASAKLAAEHAALQPDQTESDRVGTVYGSEMFYGEADEFNDLYRACQVDGQFSFERYSQEFPNRIYPLWMLRNLPNMAACHVAIANDARGPNNTVVAGDASGLLALIEGYRVIDRGSADVMFVGGTGSRVGLTAWMYRGDVDLSHYDGDPSQASRPFDRSRDGMVNGEGAATVVLESREHAEQRGARILARLAACSTTMTACDSESARTAALARALQTLVEQSPVGREIGHVNAHGLSTVSSDRIEAAAIRNVLGDVPVTALKSYFGNLGPGGGVAEFAASILALEHRQVPPTLNYRTPDPECPVNVVCGQPLVDAPPSAVKISMSATGQTAAVLVYR